MRRNVLVLLIMTVVVAVGFAQEKRVYNDGEVDFAPTEARFELSAEEFESNLKEIQYSINGGELQVYTEPIRLSEEGRNVITYRATDVTGNVSDERAYTVVIDTTPPELTGTARGHAFVEDGEAYIRSDTVVMLDATDNLSGVWNIYVSDDGEKFVRLRDIRSYIPLEGHREAYAYAVDNVGNKSRTFRVSGYVDNTGPRITIVPRNPLTIVQGERFTTPSNTFLVRASDSVAGVEEVQISLDGGSFVTYGGPVSFASAGDHTIRARAYDRLGNVSAVEELEVTIDVAKPEPQIRAIIGN